MTVFTTPTKKIYDHADLPNFKQSIAYDNLKSTLLKIIEKIKGAEVPQSAFDVDLVTRVKTNTRLKPTLKGPEVEAFKAEEIDGPRNFLGVLNVLTKLNKLIDETPPLEGPRRFGNLACRAWHDKAIEGIEEILKEDLILPGYADYVKELKFYLLNSFGSQIRLDYGTGHELAFLAFLGGLFDYGVLEYDSITGPQILVLFAKYYDLVRRLILVYNLEPAGSHGVWGLDDHFHLIYILGAAQYNPSTPHSVLESSQPLGVANLPRVTKSTVVNPPVTHPGTATTPQVSHILTTTSINSFKGSNMYVNAIAFIFKIKLGPFNEHSPILYDIHVNVSLWSKVLQGLLKMYEVEVLGKFPVVQHFWFGTALYPWRDLQSGKDLPVNQIEEQDEDGGFLNGRGVNTTRTNVSMTGAPWANTARPQVGTPRVARR